MNVMQVCTQIERHMVEEDIKGRNALNREARSLCYDPLKETQ